jgi:hypothetical protein
MPDERGLLTAEERAALEAEAADLDAECLRQDAAGVKVYGSEIFRRWQTILSCLGADDRLRLQLEQDELAEERPELRALAEAAAADDAGCFVPAHDWRPNLVWARIVADRLAEMGYRVAPYRESGR